MRVYPKPLLNTNMRLGFFVQDSVRKRTTPKTAHFFSHTRRTETGRNGATNLDPIIQYQNGALFWLYLQPTASQPHSLTPHSLPPCSFLF